MIHEHRRTKNIYNSQSMEESEASPIKQLEHYQHANAGALPFSIILKIITAILRFWFSSSMHMVLKNENCSLWNDLDKEAEYMY